VPYFIILLCLTPDGFNWQMENAATQGVNTTLTLIFLPVLKLHQVFWKRKSVYIAHMEQEDRTSLQNFYIWNKVKIQMLKLMNCFVNHILP
jgi:hypothetical protein